MVPGAPHAADGDEGGVFHSSDSERALTRKPRQLTLSRPGGEPQEREPEAPPPAFQEREVILSPIGEGLGVKPIFEPKEPKGKDERQDPGEKDGYKTKGGSQKQIGLSLKGSKLNSLRRGSNPNEKPAKQVQQTNKQHEMHAENQRNRIHSDTGVDHNFSKSDQAAQDARYRAQSLSSVLPVPSFGSIKWHKKKHWEDVVKSNQEADDLCEAAWRGDLQEVQRILEHSTVPDIVNITNQRGIDFFHSHALLTKDKPLYIVPADKAMLKLSNIYSNVIQLI